MKKLFCIIFLLICSLTSYSLNFSVLPTGFAIDLAKVSTHEITISNNTSEPLRLEAYFESDPTFGEKYSLNSLATIFPKTISIKPASKQTIRFRIKPSTNLEKGEYKSYLTFKEIPAEIKTIPSNQNNNNMATNLQMITEISISVFGQNGTSVLKGSLSNVKLEYSGNSITTSATTLSEGNTSIKFYYNLKVLNSNTELEGMLGMSAREGKKDIKVSIDPGMNLKDKKIKFTVVDQDGKVYYDKIHSL